MPVKYEAASGGAAAPLLASGKYAMWGGLNVPGESTAIPDGYAIFLRFPVSRGVTIDRIGLEITVAAASSVVRLGIYDDVAGVPTNLILDAGTIDSSGTGFLSITISQALSAGVVWLVAVPQGASTVKWRMSDGGDIGGAISATGGTASAYARSSYWANPIAGALPNPISGLSVNNGADAVRPRIGVRVA